MQSREELYSLIRKEKPKLSSETIVEWIEYLVQLKDCELYSTIGQEDDQVGWLRARSHGIGGSDIAAIMGESKWNSTRGIWLTKVGQIDFEEKQQSEAARWGNVLEQSIATEWAERNNRKYVHIPVTLKSTKYPWMFANVDGFTLDETGTNVMGILEIKTTSAYNNDVWENGPLPYYYMCQANWYLATTSLPMYDIVCLVGGQKLYSYQLPRDNELIAREIDEGGNFWNNYVIPMIEPPAAASDVEALKEQANDGEEQVVTKIADDDATENLVETYIQLRAKIKAMEDVKDAVYAQIFAAMGNASECLTQSHTIKVSTSNRRKVDYTLLEEKYPRAYEECIINTKSTSLRIK